MSRTSWYSGISWPIAGRASSRRPCFWMSFSPFFGPMPSIPWLKSVPIMMHTSTSCSLVTPRSWSMAFVSMISVLTSL